MDIIEAAKILEESNALLKEHIEEILSFQEDIPVGDNPYASLDYCRREYEAVQLAVAALRAQPENKPLTLDELREMDGEPVWVQGETVFGTKTAGYKVLIPNNAITAIVRFTDGRDLVAANYGKTWLAYRYKPEEEHHEAD